MSYTDQINVRKTMLHSITENLHEFIKDHQLPFAIIHKMIDLFQ